MSSRHFPEPKPLKKHFTVRMFKILSTNHEAQPTHKFRNGNFSGYYLFEKVFFEVFCCAACIKLQWLKRYAISF